MTGDNTPGAIPERELLLALVCYGGVSLAVYMHGITRGILKLVRASRAYHVRWPEIAQPVPSTKTIVDTAASWIPRPCTSSCCSRLAVPCGCGC